MKIVMIAWMLTLANRLFYLEMWSDVPLDFHYPSSFQLLINQEPVKWSQFVRFALFIRLATGNTAAKHYLSV